MAILKLSLLLILSIGLTNGSALGAIANLKTRIKSILNFGNPSVSDGITPILSRTFAAKEEEIKDSNLTKEDDKVNTIFGKPAADKSSLLHSLFEINAKEFSDNGEFVGDSPYKLKEPNIEEFNSIRTLFHDISFLPLVKRKHHHKHNISLDTPLLKYIETVRKDAWNQFKTIIKNYISTVDSTDPNGFKATNSFPVKMALNLLDMGDNLNIIHLLGKKIDPEVASHLINKVKLSAPDMLGLKNITEKNITSFLPSFSNIINKFAWMSLRHITKDLLIKVNQTYRMDELNNYIEDLKETNPFAAKGLEFVLHLPADNPIYDSGGTGRSLNINRKQRISSRDSYYDDGYGHNDGYGDHHDDGYLHDDGYKYKESYGHKDSGYGHKDIGYGGYGLHDGGSYGTGGHHKNVYLDPYLILAGIGTAALLAFVAYRILTTTTGKRRKRSDDPDLILEVVNSIEKGEKLYEPDTFLNAGEILVDGVNKMWKDKSTGGCARCSFFNITFDNISKHTGTLQLLILSFLAKALDVDQPGQLMDQTTHAVFQGKRVKCTKKGKSCSLNELPRFSTG